MLWKNNGQQTDPNAWMRVLQNVRLHTEHTEWKAGNE